MSGLGALGLACNIFEVISFAHETISFCKRVYEGEAPSADLHRSAQLLAATSKDLQKHDEGLRQKSCTPAQKRLHDAAQRCHVVARGLEDETQYLIHHHKKGDLVALIKITVKSTWRRKRLNRLERTMADCQRQMDTLLLHRICSQAEAIEIQQKTDFTMLDGSMQQIVDDIAQGQAGTARLITEAAHAMSGHVTVHLTRMSHALSSRLDETQQVVDQAANRLIEEARVAHERAVSGSQRDQVLRSLKYTGMNERRSTLKEPEHGTYRWIFGGTSASNAKSTDADDLESQKSRFDDFGDWLKSNSPTYWISGKPGSGKSTLVKYVASAPETRQSLRLWEDGCLIISHYFWKAGALMQKNLRGLYLSLLHQIFTNQPSALDSAIVMLREDGDLAMITEAADWPTTLLRDLLVSTLERPSLRVCIFIDGLDEVSHGDGPSDILTLCDVISKVPGIKLCVSSRPEPRYRSKLSLVQHLRLEDLTYRDMERFIHCKLPCPDQWPPERHKRFLCEVVDKAEGVFLWLFLSAQGLEDGMIQGDDPSVLRKRLQDLPGEVEDLYWEMWKKQNGKTTVYHKFASRVINLQMHSRYNSLLAEGMTLATMAIATETHYPKDILSDIQGQTELWKEFAAIIRARCAGLIEFESTKLGGWHTKLHFVHRSAFDFFAETERGRLVCSYFRRSSQYFQTKFFLSTCESWKLFAATRSDKSRPYYEEHHWRWPMLLLPHVKEPELVAEISNALDSFVNELRADSSVLSAQLLAGVCKVGYVEKYGDMVLGHLRSMPNNKRGPEASTVLRHVLPKLHEYPSSFLPALLEAGANFIGPRTLTVAEGKFFARTALDTLLTDWAAGDEVFKPALTILLESPYLPLTHKTCIGLSFVHGIQFLIPRHPISDTGQGTAQFYFTVNLAFLLEAIISGEGKQDLRNLAARHLRDQPPSARCIACVKNKISHTMFYIPEQEESEEMVSVFKSCVRPFGPKRPPWIYLSELSHFPEEGHSRWKTMAKMDAVTFVRWLVFNVNICRWDV